MSHEHLMRGMSVQHLLFTVRPIESIVFSDHPGSALRGALYQALSANFCSEPDGALTPDHAARCPVCWLLAAEDAHSARGRNTPRPLTVEPPDRHIYHRDAELTFGISLIGKAQDLLPYLARAVQKMGQQGVGKGRGRFRLQMIAEYNPLFDAARPLMSQNVVHQPTMQITSGQISEHAAKGRPDRITIVLRTPLRLIAEDRLVRQPNPGVFVQRLIERCQNLADHYAETVSLPQREEWVSALHELLADAVHLRIAYDDTQWVEGWSGSRRRGGYTPVSGLVGTFRWEGDVTRLRPWLLWGQSLHVGKDAVKGNGWYRILA